MDDDEAAMKAISSLLAGIIHVPVHSSYVNAIACD